MHADLIQRSARAHKSLYPSLHFVGLKAATGLKLCAKGGTLLLTSPNGKLSSDTAGGLIRHSKHLAGQIRATSYTHKHTHPFPSRSTVEFKKQAACHVTLGTSHLCPEITPLPCVKTITLFAAGSLLLGHQNAAADWGCIFSFQLHTGN